MRTPQSHWEQIKHTVFWDRDVELSAWTEGFENGHRSYFPQSIMRMYPRDAGALLGVERFLKIWPAVRVHAEKYPEVRRRIRLWDAAWSKSVSGAYSVIPLTHWSTLSKRGREFLIWVANHSGQSIYAASKVTGMTYKRAHEHAQNLTRMGFLAQKMDTTGPRRKNLLYAIG